MALFSFHIDKLIVKPDDTKLDLIIDKLSEILGKLPAAGDEETRKQIYDGLTKAIEQLEKTV